MGSEVPQPPSTTEAEEERQDGEAGTVAVPAPPSMIELPAGEALDGSQADELLKITPGRIILLAGEDATGKTTLSCGVYEQYTKGDFAGRRFAGSRTLRAFEQRIFFQRAESERPEPTMERTRLVPGETELLHLELQSKQDNERVALMLSDLAGEAFNLIRNDPGECQKYPVLQRVDCVMMLLDGARLIDSTERHGHVNSTRTTLRSLLQSGMVRAGVPVIAVLSKWDLLAEKAQRELAREDAERVLGAVGTVHSEHRTDIIRVAAAPPVEDSVKAGHGLQKLINVWFASHADDEASGWVAEVEEEPESPFDSFGENDSDGR